MPKKVRTFCFGKLVKKLAHTHGFEHETSGLKTKHLTTRPRTRETCELSRGKKKHPHFPITLAYRKCKYTVGFTVSPRQVQTFKFQLACSKILSFHLRIVVYFPPSSNGGGKSLSVMRFFPNSAKFCSA